MLRTLSNNGIEFIKSFEGLSLVAYPDPATGKEPYTIGYGHTGGVKPRDVITIEQADALFLEDIQRFCKVVHNSTKGYLNANQFDALVSICYNIGTGNFCNSTLLKLVNAGKHNQVGLEFLRWDKADGKVMEGLARRRAAEAELFNRRIV